MIDFDIEYELIENKSKFISYVLTDFTNPSEVDTIIKQLKKTHKKARHYCYAYSFESDGIEHKRYSDDGEPTGTAGRPILSMIEKLEQKNILVIVVRYFGGKKLGSSKLLRTYAKSARETIKLVKE